MARYLPRSVSSIRQLPGQLSSLLASRQMKRVVPPSTSGRLRLSSTKDKEGVLKPLRQTAYTPEAMRLQHLVRLARAGKILDPAEARKFIEYAQSGKVLASKEQIMKFDRLLLKGEHQALNETQAHHLLSYQYRSPGQETHQATELYHQQEHEHRTKQQRLASEQQRMSQTDEIVIRRQRLNALLDRIRPPSAPSAATTSSPRPSSTNQQPTPVEPTPLAHARLAQTPSLMQYAPVADEAMPGPPVHEPPIRPAGPAATASTRQPSPTPAETPPAPAASLPDTSHVDEGLPF